MYDDLDEKDMPEEWEDTISSFVPAFAGVKVEVLNPSELDAHLVIDKDGDLAIRLLDEHETSAFTFKFKDLFEFDTEQFHQEEWELYFGLNETMRQLYDIHEAFKGRCAEVDKIMKLRDDQPPVN